MQTDQVFIQMRAVCSIFVHRVSVVLWVIQQIIIADHHVQLTMADLACLTGQLQFSLSQRTPPTPLPKTFSRVHLIILQRWMQVISALMLLYQQAHRLQVALQNSYSGKLEKGHQLNWDFLYLARYCSLALLIAKELIKELHVDSIVVHFDLMCHNWMADVIVCYSNNQCSISAENCLVFGG